MSYHSSITGKFVTKEYAEANPETTVKLSHVNLREELIEFISYIGAEVTKETLDQYLKTKE